MAPKWVLALRNSIAAGLLPSLNLLQPSTWFWAVAKYGCKSPESQRLVSRACDFHSSNLHTRTLPTFKISKFHTLEYTIRMIFFLLIVFIRTLPIPLEADPLTNEDPREKTPGEAWTLMKPLPAQLARFMALSICTAIRQRIVAIGPDLSPGQGEERRSGVQKDASQASLRCSNVVNAERKRSFP